ncbi:ABC transporter ATP-binding protein [Thioalkalivibrio thiocyanodenitrificans]|uniref:ABC transporter ATP-binding protein n=1 Tax=Thioalkalivibrio thiocyanodenitrificans TaxID=243063 RepID=UPI0003744E98|nr:ABC transporter ATP-binding protein [Thioalkalivibrio thiocyanodenitrificans]
MKPCVIEARGVHLRIGTSTLLTDAGVRVAPGQLVALVGPNGAGKSTLMKILAGLNQADRGDIRVCGEPISRWSAMERAARIAYLPQQSRVYWDYRVSDVLALGAERGRDFSARPFGGARRTRPIAPELLREFELEHLVARVFQTLSGGEQARVLLAASLATRPQILLADEPTASLDVAHQLSLVDRLKSRTRAGLAALVVMHDLNLAARFADRIVVMAAGRTWLEGPTDEVIESPELDLRFGVRFRRIHLGGHCVLVPEQADGDQATTGSVGGRPGPASALAGPGGIR